MQPINPSYSYTHTHVRFYAILRFRKSPVAWHRKTDVEFISVNQAFTISSYKGVKPVIIAVADYAYNVPHIRPGVSI